MKRMLQIMFDDQREKLSILLNRGIPVLIYHGIFDMIIPVPTTIETILNTDWNEHILWRGTDRKPYQYVTKNGIQKLIGYKQSGGGLDFVAVLNSGHMVPIDQPAAALQIVKDFLAKSPPGGKYKYITWVFT